MLWDTFQYPLRRSAVSQMAFLRKLLQSSAKKTKEYPNIRKETDPLEQWNKIGELGDGAFGKVYKVRRLL